MRALLLFSSLAWACSYPSQYTAPLDGRARAVWTGSGVAVELAGAPLSDVCATQLGAYAAEGRIHLSTGELKPTPLAPDDRPRMVAPSVWVPIYYGAPLITLGGVPPLLPRAPLFAPTLAAGALVNASNVRAPSAPAAADELAHLGAIVAVVAILVLPVVDLTLALVPAENGTRAAEAIDQANVYNDQARSPGSPCAYAAQ